jgi:hypothetical protein
MTELVYLTLSHLNRETRKYFLNKAGYASLLDYELSTDNRLFEICWNKHTSTFVSDSSCFVFPDQQQYFSRNIPFSSLSYMVKKYIYSRFLSGTSYQNFEEYYLNTSDALPSICVFIPYKSERLSHFLPQDKNFVIHLRENSERVVSKVDSCLSITNVNERPLSKFTFHLNKKTLNSYVLCPPSGDFAMNPDKYGVKGWRLFENGSPIFYRKSLGGFTVSKKYYRKLLELGAFDNN